MRSSSPQTMREMAVIAAAVTLGVAGAIALRMALGMPSFWDFRVFYSSANAAVRGFNIYTTYAAEGFPYWYFPWLAWFFIPFTIFSFSTAKLLYLAMSLASALAVIHALGRHFNPRLSLAFQLFIAAMSFLMCMLLFMAGQMDFLLLGAVAAVMLLLHNRKPVWAGSLFPVLLFKPHILAVFLPFVLVRGGRRFQLTAFATVLILCLVGFAVVPHWPAEMIRMLSDHGGRADNFWNFITLSQLLGNQENWSGTANLPASLALIAVGLVVSWRFRQLPLVPFLALTLAASMFCAPRAYTYNLPILIPPLLWITVNQRRWGPLIWLAAGLGTVAARWSTDAYVIVFLVFVLAVLEARRSETAKSAEGPKRA